MHRRVAGLGIGGSPVYFSFMKTFDFLVIGGGSGGVRAARLAAQQGLKTAIIEKKHWGGTCVNLGCIPKKYMVLAADYRKDFYSAQDYGWRFNQPSFDWQTLRTQIHSETGRLQSIYQELLTEAGVELIEGEGHFLSPTQVQVGSSHYEAKRILLATGSRPFVPPIEGKEHGWVSDDIFSMPRLPKRMAILGGGYIALEFACILSSFGVRVTLIHRSSRLLRQIDEELAQFFTSEMSKEIRLLLNTQVAAIAKNRDLSYSLRLNSGTSQQVDAVLFALGRIPNSNMGLDKTGVAVGERGEVLVDDYYGSSQPHIFAVGDLIAKKALTPVALAEASMVVASDFGARKIPVLNYDEIPTAIFCRPELAMIGKSEAMARQTGEIEGTGEIEVYRSSFFPMKQMFAKDKERKRFFIKLLCERDRGKLLGIHLAGEGAAEIMQGFAAAYANGLTKRDLDRTISIHPTIAEELISLK